FQSDRAGWGETCSERNLEWNPGAPPRADHRLGPPSRGTGPDEEGSNTTLEYWLACVTVVACSTRRWSLRRADACPRRHRRLAGACSAPTPAAGQGPAAGSASWWGGRRSV